MKKTPIAAGTASASFLVDTRLLLNFEQVANPLELHHLNRLDNAAPKRKRKTPPGLHI
jgi:hypothetical protein